MKKIPVSSGTPGVFPSPVTLNYRSDGGLQKGWSSERAPLQANYSRRYASYTTMPFNSGRGLPSKWEDAEKWICSPVMGESNNRPSVAPPRPKSKSGPLGPPGHAYYTAASPFMIPAYDGGRIGNFMGNSPFSAGVMGMDGSVRQADHGIGGCRVSYDGPTEPFIARTTSVRGSLDLSTPDSLPLSQDVKPDGIKDDATTTTSHDFSRRDMATQISPEGSSHSCSKGRGCDSTSPSSLPLIEQLKSLHSPKLEVKDVQVDDHVAMTRWSKKTRSCRPDKGLSNIGEHREKALDVQVPTWDISETDKSISKIKREEAKITAWENLQKAKAEAELRKLEVKLENIRTSSMDKIMHKLRSAQRKAQAMRRHVSANQVDGVARTSENVSPFRKIGRISALGGCFTCHAS